MDMYENKSFDELTFIDDFMFQAIVGNPKYIDIVKELTEIILDRKIYKMTPVITEKKEKPEYASSGVRFDAQFEADRAITVIEMQNYDDDLELRAKYYGDVIDVQRFKGLTGRKRYKNLPETIVIFVLAKDFLGGNLQKYTIQSKVLENLELKYDDKRTTIFINPKAYSNNKKLNTFCKYLVHGKTEDEFTKRLANAIEEVKEDEVIRGAFMSLEDATQHRIDIAVEAAVEAAVDAAVKKARKESTEEGRLDANLSVAKNLLSMGMSKQDISKATGLSLDVIKSIKV